MDPVCAQRRGAAPTPILQPSAARTLQVAQVTFGVPHLSISRFLTFVSHVVNVASAYLIFMGSNTTFPKAIVNKLLFTLKFI